MSDKIVIEIDKDLEDIMPMFLENRKKDITQIEEFLSSNDISNIQVIAHKLAGNAGSYGLSELGEIGANMEQACLNNDTDSIKDLYDKYKVYMSNLEIKYV